jgi:hypothetical protein
MAIEKDLASERPQELPSYVAIATEKCRRKEVPMPHDNISDIYTYMRRHAAHLGDRILREYPALHQFDDAVSPRIAGLLRTPFPAQTIAIMGSLNAGSRPEPPWWSRNAAPARH